MVDWGLEERGRELHVAEMHAADRHQHPDTRLPPDADMSREDETELNVMDFVETEYNADVCDVAEQGRKRKKSHPRAQGSQRKARNTKKSKQNAKVASEGGRTAYKRRKRKHSDKHTEKGNVEQQYPYATILKNLCDKVGSSQDSPEDLPRIFSQLRYTDVHYPYASLLQALHRHAGVGPRRDTSPSRAGPSLEVARVMRNLHYPLAASGDNEEEADSPSMLFSTLLMMTVMQQKVQSQGTSPATPADPTGGMAGIGEILRGQMPRPQKDDLPPSELSSASLLRKISLSAEKDQVTSGQKRCFSGPQLGAVWSSTESSHSEADDRDWRPTHWVAKKVSGDTTSPGKRKSGRKNNTQSCPLELEQPNTSQGAQGAGRSRQQRCVASESARARLLQFIMDRRQGETTDKKSKKALKRAKVSKKRGKRKHANNTQKHSEDWTTTLPEEGLTVTVRRGSSRRAVREPQSLLKEYLLKPAGEEMVSSDNCDIPKLESSFLFSRLLQNFKNLAESCQPDDPSERPTKSSRGPSILRGMLATSGGGDQAVESLFLSDCQSASLSPLGQQQETKVKVKQEIKVECEEIVCKVEVEEDGFECQVCHLQFSSLTDLSNHQVLFHCAEDPPTPTGSHRLLGCAVEGLAGGVMQGKQPA